MQNKEIDVVTYGVFVSQTLTSYISQSCEAERMRGVRSAPMTGQVSASTARVMDVFTDAVLQWSR